MSKPLSLKAAMKLQKGHLMPPAPIHSDHLRSEIKAKSWTQRMAMKEAKSGNGVWKEFKAILDCLRAEAGEEWEKKGEVREVPTLSLSTAGMCWVLADASRELTMSQALELSEHRTHFYVLKTMHICI